jgi:hypothetical protein
MNIYRVIIEEVRQVIAHVEAEDPVAAEIRAIIGIGTVIEEKVFPAKIKAVSKLKKRIGET